jgi:murein DD-endopeptidase MepM/ murein hydrolase activator NlpD
MSDLQFKQIRLPFKAKFLRFLFWFGISIVISAFYAFLFTKQFGSPKERMLAQQMENLKLEYSLMDKKLDNTVEILNSLRMSDDRRYRPILNMDSIPETNRRGGIGGVDRFTELRNFQNADMLIYFRSRLEEVKNMAYVQKESFDAIDERAKDWKRQMDHFPGISPVSVKFRMGDGFIFRKVHPVLGTARMHAGQDFSVPYGTEVYATGDGTVIEAGWNSGGFGKYIVIDHDYGLESVYGHLSEIKVVKGMNVKRGDLIGLSGSSGLSSGPHLHYQVEQKGRGAINPVHYINNDMNAEEYNEMIQAFGSKSRYR